MPGCWLHTKRFTDFNIQRQFHRWEKRGKGFWEEEADLLWHLKALSKFLLGCSLGFHLLKLGFGVPSSLYPLSLLSLQCLRTFAHFFHLTFLWISVSRLLCISAKWVHGVWGIWTLGNKARGPICRCSVRSCRTIGVCSDTIEALNHGLMYAKVWTGKYEVLLWCSLLAHKEFDSGTLRFWEGSAIGRPFTSVGLSQKQFAIAFAIALTLHSLTPSWNPWDFNRHHYAFGKNSWSTMCNP